MIAYSTEMMTGMITCSREEDWDDNMQQRADDWDDNMQKRDALDETDVNTI